MSIFARAFLALVIGVAASVAMSPSGQAQLSNPFGSGAPGWIPLESGDRAMMNQAMQDALDRYEVGSASEWISEKTGRGGRAIVTDTFEVEGRRCAQLTHQFTKGPGRTYSAPLCQVEDGTWKLAF